VLQANLVRTAKMAFQARMERMVLQVLQVLQGPEDLKAQMARTVKMARTVMMVQQGTMLICRAIMDHLPHHRTVAP